MDRSPLSALSRARSTLRRAAGVSAGLVVLLGAVACGSGAAPAADPTAAPTTAASEEAHGAHGGAHAGHGGEGGVPAPTLYAVQTGPLGTVVTDGSGHLIYRSVSDSADPPTSNCTGPCAETWLPVLDADGEELDLAGVTESLVGRIQRPDGSTQLTLGGWPLYRHRDDDGSLTTTGHNGEAGTWFVVTPTGGVVTTP